MVMQMVCMCQKDDQTHFFFGGGGGVTGAVPFNKCPVHCSPVSGPECSPVRSNLSEL